MNERIYRELGEKICGNGVAKSIKQPLATFGCFILLRPLHKWLLSIQSIKLQTGLKYYLFMFMYKIITEEEEAKQS